MFPRRCVSAAVAIARRCENDRYHKSDLRPSRMGILKTRAGSRIQVYPRPRTRAQKHTGTEAHRASTGREDWAQLIKRGPRPPGGRKTHGWLHRLGRESPRRCPPSLSLSRHLVYVCVSLSATGAPSGPSPPPPPPL